MARAWLSGARVEFEPNGPLILRGPAVIVDAEGHERRFEAGHTLRIA